MKTVIVLMALLLSFSAEAVPFNTTDTLITSTTLPNSGLATEEDWMETVLATDLDVFKYDNLSPASFGYNVNDIWSMNISADTEWYMVKTGNGSSSGDRNFLFLNNVDAGLASFSLSDLGFAWNDIGKVSHITVGKSAVSAVSEPSTMALLGLGFAGVLGFRRKAYDEKSM